MIGQPIAEDLEQSVESAYQASHKAKEIQRMLDTASK